MTCRLASSLLLLALCPASRGQDPPTAPPVKAFNPQDHSKSVALEPLGVLPFKDRRPQTWLPAADGRALIGQHPFTKRLTIFRIDEPRILGQLPTRGNPQHFTANNHSVYLYDEATNRITRYPFGNLRPAKSYLLEEKQSNPRGVRIRAGASSSKSPVYVSSYDTFTLLHPEHMTRMGSKIERHYPPDRRPPRDLPIRFNDGSPSPDGRILASSSQLGWFRDYAFHLYPCRTAGSNHSLWLTYNGGHLVYQDRLYPLGQQNRAPEPQRQLTLTPGLASPLCYGEHYGPKTDPKARLQVFSAAGQNPVLHLNVERGTRPFISFKHKRLVTASDTPGFLAIYEFDAYKLAESLGVPPWLEVRGPGLAKSDHRITLELVPSYGELKDFRLIQEPPDATIKDQKILWKTPKVNQVAGFQFIVEYTSASGAEGRVFADLVVAPR